MEKDIELISKLSKYVTNNPDEQWYLGWTLGDTYVQTKVDFKEGNIQESLSDPIKIAIKLFFLDGSNDTYYFDARRWNLPHNPSEKVYLYPTTTSIIYGTNGRTGVLTTDPNWASGNNGHEKQQKANAKKQELIKTYSEMSPKVQDEVLKKLSILYCSNKD